MERPEGALYGAQMVPKCHNWGGIPLIYEGIHPKPTEREATVPRYDVSAEFNLYSEIEVDLGYHSFNEEGTEEFTDESYFSTQSVEADGGRLQFVVEADSEESAEEIAAQVISDGNEVEDSNGLTWMVSNVSFDIEKVIVPMDLDRATALVQVYLSEMEGMDDDLKEAFSFLMDTLVDQSRLLIEQRGTITELRSEITRLTTEAPEPQLGEVGL